MEKEAEEEQKTEENQEEPVETIEEAKTGEGLETEEESVEGKVEAEEEAPAVVEEEEAKPRRKKGKEEEEEIVEERIYTVPLSKAWIMPPNKRAPRAMRMIKSFIAKHMKLETRVEEEEEETPPKLVIKTEVNEKVWSRSIEKPPRKIRVRATKDKEGNITVYLAEGE